MTFYFIKTAKYLIFVEKIGLFKKETKNVREPHQCHTKISANQQKWHFRLVVILFEHVHGLNISHLCVIPIQS